MCMAGLILNTSWILSKINDEAFDRVKGKFQENRISFVNPKDHAMAGPLLAVLCDNKIIPLIDRLQFAQIIQSIIPKDVLELRWMNRYCDLMLRSLGNVQQNTAKDVRANNYANHLVNTMIPDFKKENQGVAKEASFMESLAFIYKIASCLLRCTAHNVYPFDLTVDRKTMEELEHRIFRLPVGIFESYSNEARAYALLVSWILEEVICEEDGIEEE